MGLDIKQLNASLVVPVFNEKLNLRPLVTRIHETMTAHAVADWELILVNDGSTDGSEALINELAQEFPWIRPVHFESNQGQTAAMDAGIRKATKTYVLTLDADLQNDPADLVKLCESMEEDIGCVCGVRVNRRDTWVRRASSRIANWVRNKVSQEQISDTGCSLKLFRRSVFDKIVLYEGLHRFLPTLVRMEGFGVVEVPVSHHPRAAGESKYGVWNRLFKSLADLFAVRWMKKRKLKYRIKPRGQ